MRRRPSRVPAGKGHFYRKSLVMIFIVSGIPGLIIGALVYWQTVGRVENELLQNHYRQIEQRSQSIDDQLGNLELLLSHWAFDSKFDYRLNGMDFVKHFDVTQDITKTLVAMQGSNAVIKQAELYVGGGSPVLFNPEYSPSDAGNSAAVYEKLVHERNVTYWTQAALDPKHPDTKELALVHHIPGGSLDPFGVLIFRFDSQKLADLLKTMTPYSDGDTWVWERTGQLALSVNGSASRTPFAEALRAKIDAAGTDRGSFFFKWKETTYTVSYGTLTRIADEWTYVSASPISSITGPVVFISKLVIGVSLVALLLAALLSWLASRQMYVPVRRLVTLLGGNHASGEREDEFSWIERKWRSLHDERLELNTKLEEQLPHVKESFLHQLLQGYLYAYSEEDLLRRMERFKWEVRNRRFVVLYVRLVGLASSEGKFRDGDEGLVTFAAVNLIGELAARHFAQSDTVNFHDLTAGVLLMLPEGESLPEGLHAFNEELTETVNRMLRMRVTIAVSRTAATIRDVPLAFERARQAVCYRSCDTVNEIIELDRIRPDGGDAPSELQYPFALERELIQSLRTGREDTARDCLQLFIDALAGDGAKEIDVQMGMLHLLGSVQHAVMASGIHPGRLFKGANPYSELSAIREPKRMLVWFQLKVAAPFLRELAARSDAQVKRLIEHAMLYLQERYMEDISLDSCADEVGTNPFFLSKSFKAVTGKNFIDYLTELRMDMARELLRESELKINDVASRVGYQHSYFNRIFKKVEGMTPTRYRELSREA